MVKISDEASALLASRPELKTAETRPWYQFLAAADGESADLNVFDAIGSWFDGVSAKQFVSDLNALPETVKTIRVHVNSPGGEVFEAVAIANALDKHPAVKDVQIEGLAASAATIITQGAGGKVSMADNALVMIHNPYGFAVGTAKDMRSQAEALDRIEGVIVATYRRKSSLGKAALAKMMDDTTWMNVDEALANGFADVKVKGTKAAASIDPRAIKALEIPEQYRAAVEALAQPPVAKAEVAAKAEPEPEPVAAKAEPAKAEPVLVPADPKWTLDKVLNAGLPGEFAYRLMAEGATEEDTLQLIAAEVGRVKAEESRATEIRALCKQYQLDSIGEVLVSAGTKIEDARTIVSTVRSKLDAVEIDSTVRTEGSRRKPAVSYREAIDRANNPSAFVHK